MNYAKKKTENLYVILVALITVLAVVCAIAGAVNRSRKEAPPVEDTSSVKESEADERETEKQGKDSEKEDVFNEDPSISSEDSIPTFINPTGGPLVKDYSADTPVFSLTMEDYRTHEGVDVFVEAGERILACADGKVKEIWEDPMMGMCISLDHTGGAVIIYKNISSDIPDVIAVGAEVRSGQLIAVGGESALVEIAEEPHVHFELQIDGKNVDPLDYISYEPMSDEYTE